MNVSLAIILGLTGAVSWGAADFAARFASRRVGAYRTLFFMQFFGFLALSAYLKWTIGFSGVAPGWRPWAMAILAGILNMVASLSLYHSFEVGTMSIVAPVSSSYPALTVALSLLSGERIHLLRGVGLAITLAGVILAATSFASPVKNGTAATAADGETAHAHLSKGVGWAIFAAVGFGVLFWFLGFYVVPAVGGAVSVWVMRLTALVALAGVAAPVGQSIRLPRGGVWWLLLAVGVLDTAAFVANNAGLSTGQVSV
ncbi:MAG: DMT family transporter, partial [Candidatus Acidiferrales bacterium]